MNSAPLHSNILKTLTYFDLMDFPLTKEELFGCLWESPKITYANFLEEISRLDVGHKWGYYFLFGREKIIEARRERLVCSELKMKKARQAVKKIHWVPFLKAVFICNSVGAYTAEEKSDIDVFIISSVERIWLVRFFTNLVLRFWNMRTYGENAKDKICLSFFVDDEHLNLAPLRVRDDDIHFAYWLHQMVPFYDPLNFYDRFIQANGWTNKYLPNIAFLNRRKFLKPVSDSFFSNIFKRVWEKMWQGQYGNLLENQAREIQKIKMKFSVKERAEKGDKGIVIHDNIIKLHENDSRAGIYTAWLEKTKQYAE